VDASYDLHLDSNTVGHHRSAGSQVVGAVVGPDETIITHRYSLHALHLPLDGPDKEVLGCPVCGVAAFEIERGGGLLVRWSDCDEPLRDWVCARFNDMSYQSPWVRPLGLLGFLGALAVLGYQVWRM
jgi:hypothetical protein